MAGWVLWVVLAGAFGIGEMLTTGFFLAPFAVGAALAAVVDVAGAGGIASVVVFVLVSLLTLTLVRPDRAPAPARAAADPHRLGGSGRQARDRARADRQR